MKIMILEPSAVGHDRTHNLKSLIRYSEIFRENGMAVYWLSHRRCRVSPPGVTNFPAFSYTIYDDNRRGRYPLYRRVCRFRAVSALRRRYLVHGAGKAVQTGLQHAGFHAGDHVFVPTTDWILFRTLMKMHDENRQGDFPVLHFLFMYEQAAWMTGGYPYRRMLEMLRQQDQLGKRIFVYSETARHASALCRELGLAVPACPYPAAAFRAAGPTAGKKGGGPVRVGFLGGGRRDKGFDRLPEIISHFLSRQPGPKRLELLVQRPRRQDRLAAALNRLRVMPGVRLMDNQLPLTQYNECLLSCHVMIFPYDRDVYRARGSGILWEAVSNGIPIICTRGSALEDGLTHGNGLTADTDEAFADALASVIARLPGFQKAAREAAAAYERRLQRNPVVVNAKKTAGLRDDPTT